jgi:hypothetical protein
MHAEPKDAVNTMTWHLFWYAESERQECVLETVVHSNIVAGILLSIKQAFQLESPAENIATCMDLLKTQHTSTPTLCSKLQLATGF